MESLRQRVAYLETALGNYGEQIRALNDIVAAQVVSDMSSSDSGTSVEVLLSSRSLFSSKRADTQLSTKLPRIIDPQPLEKQLAILKEFGYGTFDEWYKLLEPNLISYQEDPEAGISVEENYVASLFRKFVSPYSYGSVIDVGCGIAEQPIYLADFSQDLIVGTDPLSPDLPRNFYFHHGVAELLPWDDNSFDNAVVATSMDHFLDPNRALQEISRILKPNGMLLLWMGFIEGSKKYDPWDENAKPVDDYHMFHFARDWFEPMLKTEFKIVENIEINEVSSFYACQTRE